jgi:hypothetical protein
MQLDSKPVKRFDHRLWLQIWQPVAPFKFLPIKLAHFHFYQASSF